MASLQRLRGGGFDCETIDASEGLVWALSLHEKGVAMSPIVRHFLVGAMYLLCIWFKQESFAGHNHCESSTRLESLQMEPLRDGMPPVKDPVNIDKPHQCHIGHPNHPAYKEYMVWCELFKDEELQLETYESQREERKARERLKHNDCIGSPSNPGYKEYMFWCALFKDDELMEMWCACRSNPQDLAALIDMWFLTQLDSRK